MTKRILDVFFTLFSMSVGASAGALAFVGLMGKLDGNWPIILAIIAGAGSWGVLEVAYIKESLSS